LAPERHDFKENVQPFPAHFGHCGVYVLVASFDHYGVVDTPLDTPRPDVGHNFKFKAIVGKDESLWRESRDDHRSLILI